MIAGGNHTIIYVLDGPCRGAALPLPMGEVAEILISDGEGKFQVACVMPSQAKIEIFASPLVRGGQEVGISRKKIRPSERGADSV